MPPFLQRAKGGMEDGREKREKRCKPCALGRSSDGDKPFPHPQPALGKADEGAGEILGVEGGKIVDLLADTDEIGRAHV